MLNYYKPLKDSCAGCWCRGWGWLNDFCNCRYGFFADETWLEVLDELKKLSTVDFLLFNQSFGNEVEHVSVIGK